MCPFSLQWQRRETVEAFFRLEGGQSWVIRSTGKGQASHRAVAHGGSKVAPRGGTFPIGFEAGRLTPASTGSLCSPLRMAAPPPPPPPVLKAFLPASPSLRGFPRPLDRQMAGWESHSFTQWPGLGFCEAGCHPQRSASTQSSVAFLQFLT